MHPIKSIDSKKPVVNFLVFAGLSTARQIPKECSKGPEYWCTDLK